MLPFPAYSFLPLKQLGFWSPVVSRAAQMGFSWLMAPFPNITVSQPWLFGRITWEGFRTWRQKSWYKWPARKSKHWYILKNIWGDLNVWRVLRITAHLTVGIHPCFPKTPAFSALPLFHSFFSLLLPVFFHLNLFLSLASSFPGNVHFSFFLLLFAGEMRNSL